MFIPIRLSAGLVVHLLAESNHDINNFIEMGWDIKEYEMDA